MDAKINDIKFDMVKWMPGCCWRKPGWSRPWSSCSKPPAVRTRPKPNAQRPAPSGLFRALSPVLGVRCEAPASDSVTVVVF